MPDNVFNSSATRDSQFVHPATAASTAGDDPILPDVAAQDSIPDVPSAENWEEAEHVSPETMGWAQAFVKSAGSIARAGHILELLAKHQEQKSSECQDVTEGRSQPLDNSPLV